ncbi:MAG: cation:proton antiporter [Patescibacteria group bacterium]|nr:cation:proton antiporter [Patescibacteria group bacterium]
MSNVFLETGIIITLAAILGAGVRFFRQPLILAYITTGLIIGPLSLMGVKNQDALNFLSELGITFLLFLVGLELSLKELKTVGKIALAAGLGQIVFTSLVGFILTSLLGFNMVSSIYVSVALTFSSTIIVVKLLAEKRDLNSLYGKITVGFLLVQDFVAISALILLSGFSSNSNSWWNFPLIIIKGFLLLFLVLYLSKKVIPSVFSKIAKSSELLFLTSIAWCFVFASVSYLIGFSLEIGAFLAGLALATTQQNWQIAAKIKPLRDFFIVIFFIILGSQMVITNLSQLWFPVIALSLFVLIGNPLILMFIFGRMGLRKRTSFFAGVTVAQISEFSLILVTLGQKLGHVGGDVVGVVTMVGIITITLSSYMILYTNSFYKRLLPFLGYFEKKGLPEEYNLPETELKNHVILVGCHRLGYDLLKVFKKGKVPLVVVDFDPEVVKKLSAEGVISLFGDIADPEIMDKLNLSEARMVISTVPDLEENLILILEAQLRNRRVSIITTALDDEDAVELYRKGSDYVIVPHFLGGQHVAQIIAQHLEKDLKLSNLKEDHLEELHSRKAFLR